MKEITLEESKKLELEVLSDFVKFCEAHNLRYYLAYGTLIGAVRHKGFIPWDDDVDVQMPRDDYNKIIEIFNTENTNQRYRLISPTAKEAKHSFVKIIDTYTVKKEEGYTYDKYSYLGVDIDIFPIDGTPDKQEEFDVWYQKLYKAYKDYEFLKMGYTGSFSARIKLFLHKAARLFKTKKGCLKKAWLLHKAYPYENCEYVASVECAYNGKGNRVKKELFEETVLLEFEGIFFKAPKGYDAILRNIYGEYMQLPPIESQVTHHKNKVYWREENEKA